MGRVFFNTRTHMQSLTASYQALASDSNTTFLLNAAAGLTLTLPAVADAQEGWNCKVIIATNISSNTGIITEKVADDTNILITQINEIETDDTQEGPTSTGHTTITIANALDTIGDSLDIVCDGTSYFIRGEVALDGCIVLA